MAASYGSTAGSTTDGCTTSLAAREDSTAEHALCSQWNLSYSGCSHGPIDLNLTDHPLLASRSSKSRSSRTRTATGLQQLQLFPSTTLSNQPSAHNNSCSTCQQQAGTGNATCPSWQQGTSQMQPHTCMHGIIDKALRHKAQGTGLKMHTYKPIRPHSWQLPQGMRPCCKQHACPVQGLQPCCPAEQGWEAAHCAPPGVAWLSPHQRSSSRHHAARLTLLLLLLLMLCNGTATLEKQRGNMIQLCTPLMQSSPLEGTTDTHRPGKHYTCRHVINPHAAQIHTTQKLLLLLPWQQSSPCHELPLPLLNIPIHHLGAGAAALAATAARR